MPQERQLQWNIMLSKAVLLSSLFSIIFYYSHNNILALSLLIINSFTSTNSPFLYCQTEFIFILINNSYSLVPSLMHLRYLSCFPSLERLQHVKFILTVVLEFFPGRDLHETGNWEWQKEQSQFRFSKLGSLSSG